MPRLKAIYPKGKPCQEVRTKFRLPFKQWAVKTTRSNEKQSSFSCKAFMINTDTHIKHKRLFKIL